MYLRPRHGVELHADLDDALRDWQSEFPGLAVEAIADAYRFVAPHALHSTHESHFAKALAEFLDYMDSGEWPSDLQARILTRHQLLTDALLLANQQAQGSDRT